MLLEGVGGQSALTRGEGGGGGGAQRRPSSQALLEPKLEPGCEDGGDGDGMDVEMGEAATTAAVAARADADAPSLTLALSSSEAMEHEDGETLDGADASLSHPLSEPGGSDSAVVKAEKGESLLSLGTTASGKQCSRCKQVKSLGCFCRCGEQGGAPAQACKRARTFSAACAWAARATGLTPRCLGGHAGASPGLWRAATPLHPMLQTRNLTAG
eukprot:316612-Chlamydomonas_euryale.AAC.6